jgi:L-fuconolactonase
MKIDSHHHFWRYDAVEYGWIDDSMAAIRRDFFPEQLYTEITKAGIDGVVSVQARQSLVETEWLLSLASDHAFIQGVVGWVNMVSPRVSAELESFAAHPKFKAVRHVIQGEPDGFLLREEFDRGIRELKKFGLAYDILIFERQLPQAIAFVDKHPDQIFVLDHLAKPRIKDEQVEPWRKNLRELARRPHVYCKASGMVTEANLASWTPEQLFAYFEIALEAFGPQRLMFGSDWPVCLAACGYQRWHGLLSKWVAKLSLAEQQRILGTNAIEAYKL